MSTIAAGARRAMATVGSNAARAPAGALGMVPPMAPDGMRAAAGIIMYQSAVCEDMNVWPCMPMFNIHNGVATLVGTWYWCDDVWIGYHRRGPLGEPTEWLA